jgi:hypothetical protein
MLFFRDVAICGEFIIKVGGIFLAPLIPGKPAKAPTKNTFSRCSGRFEVPERARELAQ